MADAVELIRIGFCSLENRLEDAIYETSLGVFVADDSLSAHGKAAEYVAELPAQQMYLGWDGESYPKFRLKRVVIR